ESRQPGVERGPGVRRAGAGVDRFGNLRRDGGCRRRGLGGPAGARTRAAAWARQPWLELVLGSGSLVWVIPTFLLAIFAQDLQSAIYGLSGVNVSGSFGTAPPTQLIWSSAVLAVRPAAYSFRQSRILIADQSRADYVRTALAKGLGWRSVVIGHIVRPAAAGLVQTAANSVRLMVG